eukprot:Hpha_TRINITY_DN15912_c5_g1::TRINITY_DN15912_c5_g1_i1::g.70936::m.70936/K15731/CTDSP; carboxy-terminal domain RNA polymerase II polypeptide A small phosphatase
MASGAAPVQTGRAEGSPQKTPQRRGDAVGGSPGEARGRGRRSGGGERSLAPPSPVVRAHPYAPPAGGGLVPVAQNFSLRIVSVGPPPQQQAIPEKKEDSDSEPSEATAPATPTPTAESTPPSGVATDTVVQSTRTQGRGRAAASSSNSTSWFGALFGPRSLMSTSFSQTLLPAPAGPRGRRCVVFDLDETLVHTAMAAANPQPQMVTVTRPFAADALFNAARGAEVVVWTAGVQQYAEHVVAALDPHYPRRAGAVQHVIARDERWFPEHLVGVVQTIKDLRRLGRSLDDTLLIENSPGVVVPGQHALIVPSFVGDPSDTILRSVQTLLGEFYETSTGVHDFLQSRVANGQLLRPEAKGPFYMLE